MTTTTPLQRAHAGTERLRQAFDDTFRTADFQLRRVVSRTFREARRLMRSLQRPLAARAATSLALVMPGDADIDELGDALNRLGWYLGAARTGRRELPLRIDVHVPRQLLGQISIAPANQPSYRDRLPPETRLVERGGTLGSTYDHVVVWRARSLLEPSVVAALGRVSILDPAFFRGTEFSTVEQLREATVDHGQMAAVRERSQRNFEALRARWAGARAAYALGTGPSLASLRDHHFDGPIVSCNGIVCDEELMDWLRPAVVCHADPITFGPSRFSANVRAGMVRAVERYDTCIAVPANQVPLLLRHHPELGDHILGLELLGEPGGQESWPVPRAHALRTSATHNVMTMSVLPMCAALARTVRIGGCDGYPPGKRAKTNWKHASNKAYTLADTALTSHPAFYRDRDYGDDFDTHYATLERALSHWEHQGWWFESISDSYIPALADRRVDDITEPEVPTRRARRGARRRPADTSTSHGHGAGAM